jgi:hypothetical protein
MISVKTYACIAWEPATDITFLELQRLQNKVLRTIGKFSSSTPVREFHVAFQVPYVYDYITKLCRQNHENANVRDFGKTKSDRENIRGLNLVAVTLQVTRQSL